MWWVIGYVISMMAMFILAYKKGFSDGKCLVLKEVRQKYGE